jgi:phage tail sheath gpL-like
MVINLVGLSMGYPLPGEFVQIQFAQGPSSGASAAYNALLIGNMLPTGDANIEQVYGPDTIISLSSEADFIARFGEGSELHRMGKRFLGINTSTPLYAIAVDEGAGSSQADGYITITGTATGAATLRVFVGDESVDVGIANGDTGDDIGSAVEAAVNAMSSWGCFAVDHGSGSVELIAKQGGLRGNFIKFEVQLISNVSIGVTATPASTTAFTTGSVSDNNTNVLAVIEPYRYYYVVSAAEDAANLGRLKLQVSDQALPLNGIRQRYLAGSSGASVSTANAIALGLNDPRAAVIWQQSSDLTPAELAARVAGVVSLVEAAFGFSSLNFDFFGSNANTSGLWGISAPRSGLAPTKLQQVSALNNGVTPIAAGPSGSSYLVKLITAYSLNGSSPDYRVRDWHKVSVCDRYADDLLQQASTALRGKTVGADPKVNEPSPVGAVTPVILKGMIGRKTRDYYEAGLLKDVNATLANTVVVYDPALPNRLSALIPLEPIDILDQIAFLVNQVG